MVKYGLVDSLRDIATANNWGFIMGAEDYANAAHGADDNFEDGQYLLWVDIQPNTTRGLGQAVQEINYIGSIVLLGKFEADGLTGSSLDEDIEQKYDRRLLDINTALSDELGQLACSENLRIVSENYQYVYNIFDTNFDGVICQCNIAQTDFE